ncbi:tail fiber assembly protein [Morganella morganii]|uniref:tail fiber assembly protein n=1 Tax=Morganella morganii TaxID=582 RepID=UPI0022A320CD|nr:tail fiber assembly protein [Morganella morganii]HCT4685228.1 tail fiber assembly protein [Morganella morganii]HEI8683806.1 tail fiber assembly protein [Morganella morganii]
MKDINYYYNAEHPLHPLIGQGYANEGSLPPLNALRIEPDFQEGFCPCEKDGAWINIPDYRGVTAWDKETARAVIIDDVGELPDTLTTIAPDVDCPKWNGKKWVTDKTAKKESDIAAAEAKKQFLIAEVNAETQMLQTKLALGRIKENEKALLNAWLDYLDLLEAVDTSTAPDIDWPQKPQ